MGDIIKIRAYFHHDRFYNFIDYHISLLLLDDMRLNYLGIKVGLEMDLMEVKLQEYASEKYDGLRPKIYWKINYIEKTGGGDEEK